MLDPAAIEAAAVTARSEERGLIASNPHTSAAIAFVVGIILTSIIILVP